MAEAKISIIESIYREIAKLKREESDGIFFNKSNHNKVSMWRGDIYWYYSPRLNKVVPISNPYGYPRTDITQDWIYIAHAMNGKIMRT